MAGHSREEVTEAVSLASQVKAVSVSSLSRAILELGEEGQSVLNTVVDSARAIERNAAIVEVLAAESGVYG